MIERICIHNITYCDSIAFSIILALNKQLLDGNLITKDSLNRNIGDSKATLTENALDSIFTVLERCSLL